MYNNRKVIMLIPVFARAEIFDQSRKELKDLLTPGIIDEFVAMGNKYPLPTVKENDDKLQEYCKIHGYTYFDSEYDRGLHESLNNYFKKNPQPPGTIYLVSDSDSRPGTKGFDEALVKVLCHSNSIVTCLWNFALDVNSAKRWPLDQHMEVIEGYNVLRHPAVEMFNITAWDLDAIMKLGGFHQPFKYYGGIECWLHGLTGKTNPIRYLKDYVENHTPYPINNEPEYREYKNAHLAGCTHDFRTWLKQVKGIDT